CRATFHWHEPIQWTLGDTGAPINPDSWTCDTTAAGICPDPKKCEQSDVPSEESPGAQLACDCR
ncbi:MAG: hypothetical protein KDC98_18365, partial [Planctomycetes bacterium]|nr:hypothetical protein [Planctomycetota bacterium]